MSIYKDRLGRLRFRTKTGVGASAASVREMQLAVLGGLLDRETLLCRIVGHLILYDGVCTLDDLVGVLGNTSNVYKYDGQCLVDWCDQDGRQNRRILSPLTVLLQPWLVSSPSKQDVITALSRLLALFYPGTSQTVHRLFEDIASYLSETIPGPLFAHVTHLAPITALPRSALARKALQMSIVASECQVLSDYSSHALGAAIDHALQSPIRKGGMGLVDRIISICHQHSRRNDARDKRDMLDALLIESQRVEQSDGLSAMLMAWVIDLVESGSLKERNPKPQTIEKYVRNAARGIHTHLAGQDLSALRSEDFHKAYTGILDSSSSGNRTHCLTGLKTWHAFLVEYFEVPELKDGLNDGDTIVIPKANMIWPHEIHQMLTWVELSQLEERLRIQLEVCIRLAADIRLRAKELFMLRRFNIRKNGPAVEVEVAVLANTGSLKSESARRVQVLTNSDTISKVLSWDERRQNEGAFLNDYLFGDPYHPERVYRLGRTYLLINRLLKWVTGDMSVSLHTLSHTLISHAVRNALVTPSGKDVPPLEVIANAVGHRSAQTTLTQYFHFPAEVLRYFLDREQLHLKLTSDVAQRCSGVSAAALRRRASDRRRPAQEVYWQAIFDADMSLPVEGPDSGMTLTSVGAPGFLEIGSSLSLDIVLQALGDLSAGTAVEQVALRIGGSVSFIERINAAGLSVMRELKTKKSIGSGRIVERIDDQLVTLPELSIDFARLPNQRWINVRQELHKLNMQDLRELASAWSRAFDRGYLCLADGRHCIVLFKFLHSCHISSSCLAVALSCLDPLHPVSDELEAEAKIVSAFERWFCAPPLIDRKAPRRSRPGAYLIWSSVNLSEQSMPAPAATSLTGFHALMLGAATFIRLSESNQDNYVAKAIQ